MADSSRPAPTRLSRSAAEPLSELQQPEVQQPELPSPEARLSRAQLLQKIDQLSPQQQLDLFSTWIGRLKPAQFTKMAEFIRLENDLRQELGGSIPRHNPMTEVFLKSISHRRRNSNEITPPQLYVYIRRRRKSSESGTKYLGKLFFVPGGHTYQWKEGVNGAIAFEAGNTFCLTHLRTKERRYLKLVRLDQPPPDYDYQPTGEKPTIQVGLHVEILHPQTFQPVEMKIYDYPSCLYEKGELSEALWHVEAVDVQHLSQLPVTPQTLTQTAIAKGALTRLGVARSKALKILPRLRQLRDFSQQVYGARSQWYLSEAPDGKYALTTGGKLILEFDTQRWQFVTEHSAQVLARWFYNLCAKVQTEGESLLGLGDRQLISELLVQLQNTKGKSVEEILSLIFQLEFTQK